MTNQNSQLIRRQVEQLFDNKDLEIELQCANKENSIIDSKTILAQESEGVSQLTRAYWTNRNKNGGQISLPWGSYEQTNCRIKRQKINKINKEGYIDNSVNYQKQPCVNF